MTSLYGMCDGSNAVPIELKLGPTVSFLVDGGWRVGKVVERTSFIGASKADPVARMYVMVQSRGQLFHVARDYLEPYPSEPIPEPESGVKVRIAE